MKDALVFFMLILLGFPLGAVFAVFLRWLSRQKKDLRNRQGVANGWVGLAGAVIINLLMAALHAFQHDPRAVQREIVEAAIFASLFFGAWAEARRFQKEL